VSDDIRGACAVGYMRPRILVSSALIASLDDDAVEAILLHEYAHLQRYDDVCGLLQRIVCAVVGLHPAVWWTSRHIDIEREAACDALVVTLTGAPIAYARALTLAAEVVMRGGAFTPVAAPGASVAGAGFHARVVRVLSVQAPNPRRDLGAAGVGVAALALAVGASSRLPPIISTASMPPPLTQLASVPLDTGVMNALPSVAQPVLAEKGRVEAAPRTRRASSVAPTADVVRSEEFTPTRATGEEPTPTVAATGLPGVVPLALQIGLPSQAGVSVVSALTSDAGSGGIGARASRAGTATRDAYVRAGLSVGRLFWRSGQAVADRF
jgi:lambda repressor-like predicted transcriptional regulator